MLAPVRIPTFQRPNNADFGAKAMRGLPIEFSVRKSWRLGAQAPFVVCFGSDLKGPRTQTIWL